MSARSNTTTAKYTKILLPLILSLVTVANFAFANDVDPTDTDLKVAYCIGVNKAEAEQDGIHIVGEPDSERLRKLNESLKEARKEAQSVFADNIDRLRAYLIPRTNDNNIMGLASAMRRGKIDVAKAFNGDAIQNELAQRIRPCNDLSWLPF